MEKSTVQMPKCTGCETCHERVFIFYYTYTYVDLVTFELGWKCLTKIIFYGY